MFYSFKSYDFVDFLIVRLDELENSKFINDYIELLKFTSMMIKKKIYKENNNSSKKFLIISFFTKNLESKAKRLSDSLERFKLKKFNDFDHPAIPRWLLDERVVFLKGAGLKL